MKLHIEAQLQSFGPRYDFLVTFSRKDSTYTTHLRIQADSEEDAWAELYRQIDLLVKTIGG